jgi:sec-independent protein translocase protein TatA
MLSTFLLPLANILSPLDILVIVVIALLIFGPGKLTELGKGLGDGIRNFKSSVNEQSHNDKPKDENEKEK